MRYLLATLLAVSIAGCALNQPVKKVEPEPVKEPPKQEVKQEEPTPPPKPVALEPAYFE